MIKKKKKLFKIIFSTKRVLHNRIKRAPGNRINQPQVLSDEKDRIDMKMKTAPSKLGSEIRTSKEKAFGFCFCFFFTSTHEPQFKQFIHCQKNVYIKF